MAKAENVFWYISTVALSSFSIDFRILFLSQFHSRSDQHPKELDRISAASREPALEQEREV